MKKPAYTLIFGLTADPIHKGHEQVILNSFEFAKANKLSIEKFLLVPTYQANLIAGKQQPRTAYKHRFKMCELVAEQIRTEHNYPVYVSDIEKQLFLKTNRKSFSYDTLKAIDVEYKLFVLSADHFTGRWPKFRKWHKWQDLIKENGLLIHQRPGHNINNNFIEQLKVFNSEVYVVKGLPEVDTSSTALRTALWTQRTIPKDLMAASVMSYIRKNHVYG